MAQIEGDVDLLSTIGPFGLQLQDGVTNVAPAAEFDTISHDLDGLLVLGYLTDSFVLYGHSFTIRTLRRGEKLAVAALINEYADSIAIGDAVSTATVAACTALVDNRPLTVPLSPGEQDEPLIWIRRAFVQVQQWYDPIIDGVWDKYSALQARQTQAFRDLEGKSSASRRTSTPYADSPKSGEFSQEI